MIYEISWWLLPMCNPVFGWLVKQIMLIVKGVF